MSRSTLIPRIIRKARTGEHFGPWKGRATPERLSEWRDRFNASLLPGGANAHLGTKYWLQCTLEIFDQRTGQVVATYSAPAFEVIP